MRINYINNIYYNNLNNYTDIKNSAFRGSARDVFNKSGKYLYNTLTASFRPDFEWIKFAKKIEKYYKDVDKVNVFDYGCSTGEEAYTFVMSLLVTMGDNANKFFKVIAKDIDKDNIASAKTGKIALFNGEYEEIEKNTYPYTNKFLNYDKNDKSIEFSSLIRNNVEFSQADILKDIDNLPEKNTILLCRHLMLYLEPEDLPKLFTKISDKFKDTSSVLVMGDGYARGKALNLLSELGFVQFGEIKHSFIKKY